MDLIYMNGNREDIGVLQSYELDLSFGANENDFELKVTSKDHCCESGYYICAYGTEYGGIIDAVTSDTASDDVTYSGRTWHGILNSKVLEPDDGEDYLKVSGEANTVLASLIARIGLDSLFTASTENSGINIPTYAMNRYISAYDGIRKMLKTVNAKLKMTYKGDVIILSVAPIVDYTQDGIDSDFIDFEAKQAKGKVNHLICLGSGELKDRTVLHLYADEEGNISKTQSLFGVDEYASVYEYSNVEDDSELEKSGIERLKELRQQDELSVSVNDTYNMYDIGDKIGAYDNVTGLSVAVTIEQKIVTIREGLAEVSYSTDKQSTSVSAGSSTGESASYIHAQDSAKLGGKAPEYYLTVRNLLDNSDFRNPVNQRGSTSGDYSWAYAIDRWKFNGSGYVIDENGITIPSDGHIYQRFVKGTLDGSKVYKAVFCTSDGEIIFGRISTSLENYDEVSFDNTDTSAVTIIWAALYEGSYTADTLPPYVPKGYAAELMECQLYYRRGMQAVTIGKQYSDNTVFSIVFPKMRVYPTVKLLDIVSQGWGNVDKNTYQIEWRENKGSDHYVNFASSVTADVGKTVVIVYESNAEL